MLAAHAGVSIPELKRADKIKCDAECMAREAARQAAREAMRAKSFERAHQELIRAWEKGYVLVRADGRILSKPGRICKDAGEPDTLGALQLAISARGNLLREFSSLDFNGEIRKGATVCRPVPCTCAKGSHYVEIFLTTYADGEK